MAGKFNFSPGAKISCRLVQKWLRFVLKCLPEQCVSEKRSSYFFWQNNPHLIRRKEIGQFDIEVFILYRILMVWYIFSSAVLSNWSCLTICDKLSMVSNWYNWRKPYLDPEIRIHTLTVKKYSLDHLRKGVGYESKHENEGDHQNYKSWQDLLHILSKLKVNKSWMMNHYWWQH